MAEALRLQRLDKSPLRAHFPAVVRPPSSKLGGTLFPTCFASTPSAAQLLARRGR